MFVPWRRGASASGREDPGSNAASVYGFQGNHSNAVVYNRFNTYAECTYIRICVLKKINKGIVPEVLETNNNLKIMFFLDWS
jgi:hypothetical protein